MFINMETTRSIPPQAVVTAKTGTVNNVINVKRTDFEVFDALRIDSEDSADISGTGTWTIQILTDLKRYSEVIYCFNLLNSEAL